MKVKVKVKLAINDNKDDQATQCYSRVGFAVYLNIYRRKEK